MSDAAAIARRGAACLAIFVAACQGPGGEERTALRVGAVSAVDGLAGVLYSVACDDGTHFEEWVPIAAFGLPDHVDATHAGEPFADLFAFVAEGACDVTATAMASATEALDGCDSASAEIVVSADHTTEVLLVIECTPAATGAVDVAVAVDEPPLLDLVVFDPSNVVPICTPVRITPQATDTGATPPSFEVTAVGPGGKSVDVAPDGGSVILVPALAGDYVVTVTATDGSLAATATVSLVARPLADGTTSCP